MDNIKKHFKQEIEIQKRPPHKRPSRIIIDATGPGKPKVHSERVSVGQWLQDIEDETKGVRMECDPRTGEPLEPAMDQDEPPLPYYSPHTPQPPRQPTVDDVQAKAARNMARYQWWRQNYG